VGEYISEGKGVLAVKGKVSWQAPVCCLTECASADFFKDHSVTKQIHQYNSVSAHLH